MPLPLDDPRWNNFTTAYGLSCKDVVQWLHRAYDEGMASELLGDIINDVQHQGDTSQAMYAVAPHLVALASAAEGPMARYMVMLAGHIHSSAQSASAVPCPPELVDEFQTCAVVGTKLVLRFLAEDNSFEDFKYLIAALAGFKGHGRFGRLLEGFELYEGQFYHNCLEERFPDTP